MITDLKHYVHHQKGFLPETFCDKILDELKPRKEHKSYQELISFVEDRVGHDYRYAIDFTKLMNQTLWKPSKDFEKNLHKTIDWYINKSKLQN